MSPVFSKSRLVGLSSIILCLASSASAGTLEARDANAPTCPGPGGSYTNALGYTYTIYCDTDAFGNVYFTDFSAPDLETCMQKCSEFDNGDPTVRCDAAVHDHNNNNCYLKSLGPNPTTGGNGNYDCAVLQSGPSPPPVVQYTNNPTCDGDNLKSYIDGSGNQYQVHCESDIRQNDISGKDVNSNAECAQYCADWSTNNPTNLCGAWVIPDGNGPGLCHLKANFYNAGNSNPGTFQGTVGYLQRRASDNTCNTNGTDTITLPEGDNYDFSYLTTSDASSQLSNSTQSSGCACAETCSFYNRQNAGTANPVCTGVEYDTEATGINCIVKSS